MYLEPFYSCVLIGYAFVIFYRPIYNLDPIVYIVKTKCAFWLFLKEIFYMYLKKGTYYSSNFINKAKNKMFRCSEFVFFS